MTDLTTSASSLPLPPPSMAASPAPSISWTQRSEHLRKPISALAILGIFFAIWKLAPTANPTLRLLETISGFLLVVTAVLGRLWSGVFIAGRKNAELCKVGPYSICRNPLYLFSCLGACGIVLATHRAGIALTTLVLFWGYYLLVIHSEERRLQKLFGQAFTDYCAETPRLLPRFSGYTHEATLLVNIRPLLKAFVEVIWFFAAWLGVHLYFA